MTLAEACAREIYTPSKPHISLSHWPRVRIMRDVRPGEFGRIWARDFLFSRDLHTPMDAIRHLLRHLDRATQTDGMVPILPVEVVS